MYAGKRYKLVELCERAEVTERTVRYYIKKGLLPPAERTGPGVRYPESHLWRLQLIRRLKDEHLPLAQIREQLEALSDDEVRRLVSDVEPSEPVSAVDYVRSVLERESPSPSPSDWYATPTTPRRASPGGRSSWERVSIHPDVEIHVRRPLSRRTARRVDRLIDEALTIFEEES